jgi:hypothetical protein
MKPHIVSFAGASSSENVSARFSRVSKLDSLGFYNERQQSPSLASGLTCRMNLRQLEQLVFFNTNWVCHLRFPSSFPRAIGQLGHDLLLHYYKLSVPMGPFELVLVEVKLMGCLWQLAKTWVGESHLCTRVHFFSIINHGWDWIFVVSKGCRRRNALVDLHFHVDNSSLNLVPPWKFPILIVSQKIRDMIPYSRNLFFYQQEKGQRDGEKTNA